MLNDLFAKNNNVVKIVQILAIVLSGHLLLLI